MVNSGNIEILKFNGQSFELWKLKMEDLLMEKDQWIIVDLGTTTTRFLEKVWENLDRKAKSIVEYNMRSYDKGFMGYRSLC